MSVGLWNFRDSESWKVKFWARSITLRKQFYFHTMNYSSSKSARVIDFQFRGPLVLKTFFEPLYFLKYVFKVWVFWEGHKIWKKIFVALLTRALCSARATAYLSKSRRRLLKKNVVKSYYTDFNELTIIGFKK